MRIEYIMPILYLQQYSKIHRLIFIDPCKAHFGDFFQRAGVLPSKILACWAFGAFWGLILHATILLVVLGAFTTCNKNSFILILPALAATWQCVCGHLSTV